MSTNENQRTQSINSIKAHAYGTNEEIIHKKEETKFNNEIDQYKNDYLIIYKKILIIGGSESGKTNAFLNLINHELWTDKIYLHVQDLYEVNYQFLIDEHKGAGLKHCDDSKVFIECSNDIDDI